MENFCPIKTKVFLIGIIMFFFACKNNKDLRLDINMVKPLVTTYYVKKLCNYTQICLMVNLLVYTISCH